ncbi:hypothetical protein ABPG72_014403 [Tetrahymena utriculariae]
MGNKQKQINQNQKQNQIDEKKEFIQANLNEGTILKIEIDKSVQSLKPFQVTKKVSQTLLRYENNPLQELDLYFPLFINISKIDDLKLSKTQQQDLKKVYLNLELNKIGFQEIAILLNNFFQFTLNLETVKIILSNVPIGNRGLISLSEKLAQQSSLKYLFLDLLSSCIGNQGLTQLINSLANLQNLEFLNLGIWYNYVDRQGIIYFFECLAKFKRLRFVITKIKCIDNYMSIGQRIQMPKSLVYLDIQIQKQRYDQIEFKVDKIQNIKKSFRLVNLKIKHMYDDQQYYI